MNSPPPGVEILALSDPFFLQSRQQLHGSVVAYERVRSATAGPVILVIGGLTSGTHIARTTANPQAGWWDSMVGPGRPLDTNESTVLCVNHLGGCHGSTGPASTDPRTGRPYGLDFPTISLVDVSGAICEVLDHVGVRHIDLLVGASMGAMVSLAFLDRFDGTVDNHVNISGAVVSQPSALAFRGVQRDLLRQAYLTALDDSAHRRELIKSARKLSLLSYRPPESWNMRFGRHGTSSPGTSDGVEAEQDFDIQRYLEAQADKFVDEFDPLSFVVLSEALDRFVFDVHHRPGGPNQTRRLIRRALVLGSSTDGLYPIDQQREVAEQLRDVADRVEMVKVDTPNGHDSFLIDTDLFGKHIGEFWRRVREPGRGREAYPDGFGLRAPATKE